MRVDSCPSLSARCLVTAPQQKDDKDAKTKTPTRRPKLTLKAQPVISMSPSKVTLRAELVGGANDYEEFYCPTVEWDWGDGTQSESTADCEPYEARKKRDQAALHGRSRLPRRALSGGGPPEAARQGRRARRRPRFRFRQRQPTRALSRFRLLLSSADSIPFSPPVDPSNQRPARVRRYRPSHQGGTAAPSPFLPAVSQSNRNNRDTWPPPGRSATARLRLRMRMIEADHFEAASLACAPGVDVGFRIHLRTGSNRPTGCACRRLRRSPSRPDQHAAALARQRLAGVGGDFVEHRADVNDPRTGYNASTAIAMPIPPPMHSAATP